MEFLRAVIPFTDSVIVAWGNFGNFLLFVQEKAGRTD